MYFWVIHMDIRLTNCIASLLTESSYLEMCISRINIFLFIFFPKPILQNHHFKFSYIQIHCNLTNHLKIILILLQIYLAPQFRPYLLFLRHNLFILNLMTYLNFQMVFQTLIPRYHNLILHPHLELETNLPMFSRDLPRLMFLHSICKIIIVIFLSLLIAATLSRLIP